MTEATEVAFFCFFLWGGGGGRLKNAHAGVRVRACARARTRTYGCMLLNKKHHSDVLEKT